MKKKSIYLDYAAATPLHPSVLATMQPYFSENFYNPSALYLKAKAVKSIITEARQSVAKILGCRPSEIIFIAGGSEANNLAIAGIMNRHKTANLVFSAIEHESVREGAKKFKHLEAKVLKDGRIDLDKLRKSINNQTVLVSVMYANNEIGTIQPIKEISLLVRQIRKNRQKEGNDLPLYLHTDACQVANYLDLHVNHLGVDMMTLNGGKIYGPKQSGILFVKAGTILEPLILGGGQEMDLRSGTENVAGIVGFTKALEIAVTNRERNLKNAQDLQKTFLDATNQTIPEAQINGSLKQRLPNNIHLTIPGVDNERLLMELDEQGVMCAVGSACSASKEESSHVLAAIGLSDLAARSSLRFTFGNTTTKSEIKTVVKLLKNSSQKRLTTV